MGKKQVEARSGKVFEVDTSDEACGKFGFKHGDRIIVRCLEEGHNKAIVMGVASSTCPWEPEVLWYTLEGWDGVVTYCYPQEKGDLELG